MLYYKILATNPDSAKQIIRTLKNSKSWAKTNGNNLEIFTATGNDHTKHILGIAQEFGANITQIEKNQIPKSITQIPKREYVAFDGSVFTDKLGFCLYQKHNNPKLVNTRKERWKNCLGLASNQINKERKVRASKQVVARLEPNQDFNLDGAINSLDILESKLLQAFNEVSETRKNLIKIKEYDKLLADRDDYLKSVKMILNSNHEIKV